MKFHFAINDYHKDPQLAKMERTRDRGIFSFKLDIYITSLLPTLRDHFEKPGGQNLRVMGCR